MVNCYEETTVLEKVDSSLWDGDAVSTALKAKEWAESQRDVPYLTRAAYTSGLVAPGGSLVRWVGMVQDMGSPEFYRCKGDDGCRMYRDILQPIEGATLEIDPETKQSIAERQKLYCVPVPGLAAWARRHLMGDVSELQKSSSLGAAGSSKREREEEVLEAEEGHAFGGGSEEEESNSPVASSTRQKRHDEPMMVDNESPSIYAPKVADVECLVRWYPDTETETMPAKLNDIVEVIGVLGAEVGGGAIDSEDWDAAVSKVARVHALSVKTLGHSFLPEVVNTEPERIATLKAFAIKDVIGPALNNNFMAAEYVFLTLLSRPYMRVAPDRALGGASLEIITQTDCVKELYKAISLIVPVASLIKTSKIEKPPKRDIIGLGAADEKGYSQDFFGREERLVKDHPLQLSPGTVALLDHDSFFWETCKALVGESKFTMYDFAYEEFTRIDVDIPAIVVTNNRRGIEADASVVVDDFPQNLTDDHLKNLDPLLLQDLRSYVQKARAVDDIHFDGTVAKAVQDDYLSLRKSSTIPSNLAENTLHYFLTLVRLHAKSLLADKNITIDHWRHCLALETNRLNQLKSMRRVAGL